MYCSWSCSIGLSADELSMSCYYYKLYSFRGDRLLSSSSAITSRAL